MTGHLADTAWYVIVVIATLGTPFMLGLLLAGLLLILLLSKVRLTKGGKPL